MLHLLLRCLLAVAALSALPMQSHAQQPVPPLRGHVNDLTGVLTTAQQSQLERKLADFEARKGSQLAVLIVATTAPEAIEPYALRVAEQWKLGRRKVDDGAILVIARDDHAVRIEVGYGLEGALNDATCARIIDEFMVPRLQQQDVAGAVAAGADRMMRVVDGEPLPAPAGEPAATALEQHGMTLVIAALFVSTVLRRLLGPARAAVATGGLVGLMVWWVAGVLWIALGAALAAMVLTWSGAFGVGRMVGWGGGRSGGGGYGGKGGGFGGGGASGKW